MAWLIGDQWVRKRFTAVGFKLYERLSRYFDTLDTICVVRKGQSSHTGVWYNRARRFNFFLRGFKYLFIMRKPDTSQPEREKVAKVKKWARYKPPLEIGQVMEKKGKGFQQPRLPETSPPYKKE